MTDIRIIKGLAIAVACFGFALAASDVLAETRPAAKSRVVPSIDDVALASGGTLTGRLVDGSGTPIEGARVVLHQGKQLVSESITDKSGSYVFKDLRGGVYQLTSADSQKTFRAWKNNAAPPGAREQALLVAGHNNLRGQLGAMVPAHVLLAGGTSAATVGAMALGGGNGTPLTTITAPNSSMGQNSSLTAPQGNSQGNGPQGSLPVWDDWLGGRNHDPPTVVVCPAPHSP